MEPARAASDTAPLSQWGFFARVRRWGRAWLRLAALGGLTAGLYLAWVVSRQSAGRMSRRRRLFRLWAQSVARILNMRIEVHGKPPRLPFLLACNHLGYLDVVVLAALADCVFVARHDVRGWPLIGRVVAGVDTIFVNRGRRRDVLRVNTLIEQAAARGEGIVIFPEGTSSDGRRVLPFKPSLLEAAARLGLPVSSAALSYRTPLGEIPAELSVCWWGEMTFPSHFFSLLQLPRIEACAAFDAQPIRSADRKELARSLRQSVSRLLTV